MLIQVKPLKLSSLKLSNIDFGCHSAMTQIASHRWIEASPRTSDEREKLIIALTNELFLLSKS